MIIFGKTIAYWKETIGGPFLGLIIAIIVWCVNPSYENWKDFIKEFPTMGMCAFGFLLTLLSVILQGSSPKIEWMKSRKQLFENFIQYNKRIVLLSFASSLYSYFLGYANFNWILHSIEINDVCVHIAKKIFIGVFVLLTTWFVYDTIHFIRIFYLLIKEEK